MIARVSPIVRLAIRAATPIALLIAAYALFAGHNQPGGGFAAGLMLGAVVVLRTVAGLQAPRHAVALLAIGGALVTIVAIGPLFWGRDLLDQVVITWEAPLLGPGKSGSALVFDLGVTAAVVGLVVALLDGLGATDLVDRGFRPERPSSDEPTNGENGDNGEPASDARPTDRLRHGARGRREAAP